MRFAVIANSRYSLLLQITTILQPTISSPSVPLIKAPYMQKKQYFQLAVLQINLKKMGQSFSVWVFCLLLFDYCCQLYSDHMIKQYDQLVKLILIGGSGVGKSSLLMQFAENKFTENYLTTIGVDFRFKTVKQDGRTVKFQIWDTAGQQRFRTITSAYYKGADGIIMVYDLTQPSSIDDLQNYWINQAYNYCDKSIKVLLLGNKSDCDRVVNPERIRKMAEKNGYITEEVSAKTGEKVYDSIKNFGMGIARAKMEKSGFNWYANSPSTTSSLTNNSSNVAQSAVSQEPSPPKTSNDPQPRSSNKQAPKPANKAPQTIKITTAKKGNVPSYQKKCC